MTDTQIHGRCQRIYTKNVKFSIEHQIYYSARQFYSKPDAQVIFLHLISL